jgi:thioredoxin 1
MSLLLYLSPNFSANFRMGLRPCKFIGPIFEKLASENPEIEAVKVDVDDADDVAAHCQIQAMPTFHFYKGGAKIAEMMGADQAKLAALIAEHK